jgi:hypothetical protein
MSIKYTLDYCTGVLLYHCYHFFSFKYNHDEDDVTLSLSHSFSHLPSIDRSHYCKHGKETTK